jgi:putative tricarboxylic transport membrane protein
VNRDLAFGAAGVVVAGGYYWMTASIPDSALADAVGPRGLPIAYAAVLLVLSFMLVVRSLRTRYLEPRTPDPESRIPDSGFRLRRVAGMLGFGAVYILLVPWVGYTTSLAGLLFAVTWYLGGTISRSATVVAVSGAIAFWLLFVRLLGIPHPAGVWSRLF